MKGDRVLSGQGLKAIAVVAQCIYSEIGRLSASVESICVVGGDHTERLRIPEIALAHDTVSRRWDLQGTDAKHGAKPKP